MCESGRVEERGKRGGRCCTAHTFVCAQNLTFNSKQHPPTKKKTTTKKQAGCDAAVAAAVAVQCVKEKFQPNLELVAGRIARYHAVTTEHGVPRASAHAWLKRFPMLLNHSEAALRKNIGAVIGLLAPRYLAPQGARVAIDRCPQLLSRSPANIQVFSFVSVVFLCLFFCGCVECSAGRHHHHFNLLTSPHKQQTQNQTTKPINRRSSTCSAA